ncbi:DUF192 domain-containing protein [Agaribacter marinus]|uniref:DUF192 domain-containing protein n=1 Tax=Agaribacter marinus TaxID=1431249 RepID=A0AA37WLK8_9ALTE|nr:DUF192 domain-containing protein [Agaribacter marinus]GLR72694.1 hypothetical protein GCM10007852_36020 [Agaribacter marinus]
MKDKTVGALFRNTSLITRFTFVLLIGLTTFFAVANDGESASNEDDADSRTDLVQLSINDTTINVEYADEAHERQLGLMHRREMCANCGMLFKFDTIRYASMWMKNTYIPLDVAYINVFGKIIDIKAMEPEDLTSIKSSMPILYALEMNQGWFANKGIKVGDMVTLPLSVK